MDVNQTIVKVLEDFGVQYVFGGSGQVNASMLLALRDSQKIKTVIIRNEQAASFMACGYTMFNPNNLGVCFATGGPGAFNLFSGMAVALSDSLPILAITGYTSMSQRGKGALNESTGLSRTPDSHAMFAATTKKSYIIERAEDTCDILEDAINTAFEGRPGPVHIHIPKDITTAEVTNYRPISFNIKKVSAEESVLTKAVDILAEAIRQKKKLLAIIGYGCIRSEAQEELKEFIDTYKIPFVQTMDAKGFLPENHPLCLGMYGTAGDEAANKYFNEADLVIAMGNSFAQNATFSFKPDLFEGKQLVHINIDKAEINKVYKADVAVVSDIKLALQSIMFLIKKENLSASGTPVLPVGHYYDEPEHNNSKRIFPGDFVRLLSDNLPENAIVMGDAGSHMLWLSCYLKLTKNQRYQNPGSFGPMASHTNGCIGVKCANPDKVVIAGVGDGCFQMAGFELMTAVQYNIPVIWIIFNNSEFNIIKKFLLNMYNDEAYMQFDNPDFVKYAEACGAKGFRVEKLEEFVPVLNEAIALNKPCVIDVLVDNNVYPPFSLGKV
ncbi:MAG: thiamine pyrophosphate-binding protein [Candidatus Phocaeicola faecigallinarum]|uniref:Thiamine pyrophosphate-binding protein n=1 Tax=Candidatus Phocaeicola faecigallinarum TaxID=2838732 RepID=A0A948T9K8_9BACT|nr:thiamine pyrophosphate-binding protein [Candidatus Phocaeicola faecigallinarum]